ncbi:sporulation integral membrane protein YtvI [Fictibacillus terranigra]|uniref:Sporulation integral membrane protein YtvI n=1 Tax=Fictibacillus terranigra TaxID=3058424 RepID=A0ABT8E3Z3_9BACL|nr:sporulation integral membrane protein YtvI [Fictibacillus sp. CENA-BCM004]MDN4072627.1 sporulation integral membrane protein YtvI [Fictibacillus sp. CENA-BCM004]
MNNDYLHRILRFFLIVCLFSIVLLACFFLSKVTYPFILGGIIAMSINPFVNFLEEKGRMHRGFAVFTALLLLIATLAGAVLLLMREIFTGFAYLAHVLPTYSKILVQYMEICFKEKILPLYNDINRMFNNLDDGHQQTIMKNIDAVGTHITTTVSNLAQQTVNWISTVLVSLPSIVTVLVFSILAAFFICKDWYRFSGYLRKISSDKWMASTRTVYIELRKALFGFAKAQLTLISITAFIVLIGLLLLRIEYAITIALLIGAVDLLPYLGTGAVFMPWIAYTFVSGDYPLTVGLSVLYGVVIIQRQLAEPKILSSTIGLDPLATLIALFVGFQWFGFLGLLIGPAFLVILRALHQAQFFHEVYYFIKGKS